MSTKAKILVINLRYVFFISCVLAGITKYTCAISGEHKKIYPEIGIMSEDSSDHVKVSIKMLVSDGWVTIVNKDNLTCKYLNNKISLEELKKIVVFDDADLDVMTNDNKSNYDQSSVYFKSCNYIEYYYHPLFSWRNTDKNVLFDWPATDAYIDTEHSLLLIYYLDNEKDQEEDDKKYVRALFVDKEHQIYSNKNSEGSLWNDIKKVFSAINDD